jgi:hypothetical protein
MRVRGCLFVVCCLILSSCAPTAQAPAPAPPSAAAAPVLLLRRHIPQGVQYQILAPIAVHTHPPGQQEAALTRLADEARKMGANAVMEVETTPGAPGADGSLPDATGEAIRIITPPVEDVAKQVQGQGEWR